MPNKEVLKKRGFEYVEDRFAMTVEAGKAVSDPKGVDRTIPLPVRGTPESAGYDFYCPCDVVILPHSKSPLIFTNVKAYMPSNEVLEMDIRSSFGVKKGQIKCTSGKIDADYYFNKDTGGNIAFCMYNTTNEPFKIEKGDRFCQGSFYEYKVADNDEYLNEVRSGGYGSTGVK